MYIELWLGRISWTKVHKKAHSTRYKQWESRKCDRHKNKNKVNGISAESWKQTGKGRHCEKNKHTHKHIFALHCWGTSNFVCSISITLNWCSFLEINIRGHSIRHFENSLAIYRKPIYITITKGHMRRTSVLEKSWLGCFTDCHNMQPLSGS